MDTSEIKHKTLEEPSQEPAAMDTEPIDLEAEPEADIIRNEELVRFLDTPISERPPNNAKGLHAASKADGYIYISAEAGLGSEHAAVTLQLCKVSAAISFEEHCRPSQWRTLNSCQLKGQEGSPENN